MRYLVRVSQVKQNIRAIKGLVESALLSLGRRGA